MTYRHQGFTFTDDGRLKIDSAGILAYDASGNIIGLAGPTSTIGLTLGPVTFANLLTTYPAASYSGYTAKVSNIGGPSGSFWVSDGTRWKPQNGRLTLYTLDARATMTGVTEVILGQYLIPAGVLQNFDRLRIWASLSKSSTAETFSVRIRLGTPGTITDTLLFSSGAQAAANQSEGFTHDYKLMSATTIQKLGNGGVAPYVGVNASAFPAATTISSAAANALYISLTNFNSSTVETTALEDMQIELLSTSN